MRRGPRRQAPRESEPNVNKRIRAHRVLVIDENNLKLGEFLTPDAITLAADRDLDLVEVSPNTTPPVCKIMDYGQFRYEQKKKAKEHRKSQTVIVVKEVKLRPKTDDHDIDVKVRNATRFIKAGNKVKVTIRFRGREHAHRDIGTEQCQRIFDGVNADAALAKIETPPRMDGRTMFMMMAPA